LAENVDNELDADILQCRMDIQRIRQSMANSKSGEAGGGDLRAADSAADVTSGAEEGAQEAGAAVPIESEPEAQAAQPEAIEESEDTVYPMPEMIDENVEILEEPSEPAAQDDVGQEKDPFAVTREEIDALLGDDAAEDQATVKPEEESPVLAEDASEALFGEERASEGFEDDSERMDEAENPAVISEPASMADEEPAVEEVTSGLEQPPEAAQIQGGDSTDESTMSSADDGVQVTEVRETDVLELPQNAGIDARALQDEVEERVSEAEEWMAKVAPEEKDEPAAIGEEDAPSLAAAETGGEGALPEDTLQEGEYGDALAGDENERAGKGGFDEVVSDLQGEDLIAPVEEEPSETAEAATAKERNELADDEELPTIAESTPAQEDVKLRIIRDMKDEPDKQTEERAGIPRFDLADAALGGVAEIRRNAGALRKGPGKKREEVREAAEQIGKESAKVADEAIGKETVRVSAVLSVMSTADRMRLEKEKQIIAQIVARDIERFCAAESGPRRHTEAGKI